MLEIGLGSESESKETAGSAPSVEITDAAVHALATQTDKQPWLAKHRFQPGNKMSKGRPRIADGAKKDRRTIFREAFENGGMDIVAKAMELAAAGDPKMIDVCLKYILPQNKQQSELVDLGLPEEATASERLQAIQIAVTSGKISAEAAALMSKSIKDAVESEKVLQALNGIADLQGRIKSINSKGL